MTICEALEKLTDAVRLRHFSFATEKAYARWLRSYMGSVQDFPSEWSSEQKVERFLTAEARRGVAASTQTQAFNALAFFYQAVLKTPLGTIEAARARRPERVRTGAGGGGDARAAGGGGGLCGVCDATGDAAALWVRSPLDGMAV